MGEIFMLELKKMKVELLRVEAARSELELKIMEREEEIKRLKEHVEIQELKEKELKEKITNFK